MSTAVTVWGYACMAIALGLVVANRRLGRVRVAGWLVLLGLVLLLIEEPVLTLWFALADPRGDPDGMATLITGQARAHVIDTSALGIASFVALGWIARRPFRAGERWAARVLLGGWITVAAGVVLTTWFVFSRGLPLPGPGGVTGAAGFGWQPVAAGLLSWAAGLRLGWRGYA